MSFMRLSAIAALLIGSFCWVSCGDNSSSAEFLSLSSVADNPQDASSSSEAFGWGRSSSVEMSCSSAESSSSGEFAASSSSGEPIASSSFSESVKLSSFAESNSSESPVASSSSKSLDGIVWYVVGDSFSSGDFEGLDPKPAIKEGKYAGKSPVYSYFI